MGKDHAVVDVVVSILITMLPEWLSGKKNHALLFVSTVIGIGLINVVTKFLYYFTG